jgi:hypothetical protein
MDTYFAVVFLRPPLTQHSKLLRNYYYYEITMEAIPLVTSTPDDKACAYPLLDAATRTHQTMVSTGLTDIKRFNTKKTLMGEERITELLVYSRCFDSIPSKRGGNAVDGLMYAWKTNNSPQLLKRKRLPISRQTSLII